MSVTVPRLLLVNGVILGAVAVVQFPLDFLAYGLGFGPTAGALHGNLDTIGYAEAHGLAAIIALLLILRRDDGWVGWHAVAAGTHLLLGACNLIFWAGFVRWNLVPMGIGATVMHAIFFVLQAWVWVRAQRPVTATASGAIQ
jgi:hypothetical protein